MPPEPPRQFSIVLRAPAGAIDGEKRLQALLKYAWRVHQLKCLLCAPEPAGPSPDEKPNMTDPK